jgi:hypothetical protein
VRGAVEGGATGLDGLTKVLVKQHGSDTLSLRPRLLRIVLIVVYQ